MFQTISLFSISLFLLFSTIHLIWLSWWLRWYRICLQCGRPGFDPWARKIPWRREWLPTPIFLPREFHGQRSLVGYSPWGHKESYMPEWLKLQLSLFILFISNRIAFFLIKVNIHIVKNKANISKGLHVRWWQVPGGGENKE